MVQHTESEHHVNGMIGAWGDWELTERGREEAFEVGKWLLKEGCDNNFNMYASDLGSVKYFVSQVIKSSFLVRIRI